MKAATSLTLALALATAFVAVTGTTTAEAPAVDRYIVGFHAHDLGSMSAQSSTYNGATIVQRIPDLRMLVVQAPNPALFLAQTMLDEDVRYVEWDDPFYARPMLVPNDALYGEPGHYGSKIIGAEAAWDRTLGTTAVKVGMLDSGLNKGHEEYAGQARVLQGFDFVSNDDDPQDTSGCSWHGTHTTGTAGATINNGKGIAGLSQHTILPVRAFSASFFGCGGSESAIVNGLKYIGDQGSHLSSNSWGGGGSSAITDAIRYAHNKGAVHVAAAGNAGPCSNCVSEPWKSNQAIVIIVSSTTSSDTQSSFSSDGPEVDVAAPGSSILSSTSGTATYGTLSGTSMATPHVTGTAALMKALNPSFTFSDIESRLCSTAVDLGTAGEDNEFGCGRIDAAAATGGGGGGTPAACADGVDNDGDGRIDFPDDPGCTSSSDNDETDAPPPASSVHTHDIDSFRNGKTPRFQIWAFNNNEAAEAGVTVSVQVCKSGGSCATGSADTGADGSVTFQWKNAGSGTYQTCVTDMAKAGFTWDQAAGHASSGNCHTETV